MITEQKTILIIVSIWCILEIGKGRRNAKPFAVVLCVGCCHDLLEPIVRCMRHEFESSWPKRKFQVSLSVHSNRATGDLNELNTKVRFLCKEGLLSLDPFDEPDLVLYLGPPSP